MARIESGVEPEVVILDLNMPGLGGRGTLPLLRAIRPTLPVLLATGRADPTALNLLGAYPGTALVSKPFSLDALRTELDEVMSRPGKRH